MASSQNNQNYGLEDRTYEFAKKCRDFVKKIQRTITNIEYGKQLIRSSGSQAANFIEAVEAISKKDYCHRLKICRKETKESKLWLKLCTTENNHLLEKERQELIQEALELTKIFGSIITKNKL